VKVLPFRLYLVKMDKNKRVVRRNDKFIKGIKTFQRLANEDEIKEQEKELVVRRSQRQKRAPIRYGAHFT